MLQEATASNMTLFSRTTLAARFSKISIHFYQYIWCNSPCDKKNSSIAAFNNIPRKKK